MRSHLKLIWKASLKNEISRFLFIRYLKFVFSNEHLGVKGVIFNIRQANPANQWTWYLLVKKHFSAGNKTLPIEWLKLNRAIQRDGFGKLWRSQSVFTSINLSDARQSFFRRFWILMRAWVIWLLTRTNCIHVQNILIGFDLSQTTV